MTQKKTIILDGVEYELIPIKKTKTPDQIEKERIANLPKTWEESIKYGQSCFVVGNKNGIYNVLIVNPKEEYKTCSHTREQGEALLILHQLIWLRDIYNGNWKPKLNGTESYPCITYDIDEYKIQHLSCTYRLLMFKTDELAELFLENFKDLLEQAKNLY